jgi:hypothetical protein
VRSCSVVLQASARPRTSISARRLLSRNPQGHNHVFLQALSAEAEVRLPQQEADKAWRASALRPKVQVCAANPQLVRRVLLAGLIHSRRRFDQSILSWLSNAIQLEHTLAHRKRVWVGRHRINANVQRIGNAFGSAGRRAGAHLTVGRRRFFCP